MKKVLEYRYEAYLFIIEAVCMILELCAERVLSPYFGDSHIVWTSIIGIILLSASIGNAIGGKLADKEGMERRLCLLTIVPAAFILAIPIFSDLLLSLVAVFVPGVKLGAIVGTVLLFMPPSLAFGTIPPMIMKLRLKDLETVGKTSGRLQSMSTLGSILGTFLGGFVLVPLFGSRSILFALAVVVAFTVLLIGGKTRVKAIATVLAVAVLFGYAFAAVRKDAEAEVLAGVPGASVEYDTQYSKVIISNQEVDGRLWRNMIIGDGCESATYVVEDMKYELCFAYTKSYELAFRSEKAIQSLLMIGGGGYSYPKYCVSHHPDVVMDVVEIDPRITELARKYFYLDDALAEFNTAESTRLNLITADGKVYINTANKKYDAILNDAFSGTIPVKSLTTLETVRQVHDLLNPGGVYLSNIIGSAKGEGSRFLVAEVYTLRQVFPYVYAVPCLDEGVLWAEDIVINYMVVASDWPLDLPDAVALDLTGAVLLTDDYCPVDTLVPELRD